MLPKKARRPKPAGKLLLSVVCVGKKSYLTSTLNSCCKSALMSCACTCYTTGENLLSVGSVLAELIDVFVVDVVNFIYTERANLFTSFSVGTVAFIVSHLKNLLFKLDGDNQKGRSSSSEISSKSLSLPEVNEGAGAAGAAGAE